MPKINVTAPKGESFEAWPAGEYPFRITKVDQAVSKEKNHPQLIFGLECIEGPYEGKKRNWRVTMAPNSGWDIGNILAAAIPGNYDATESTELDQNGKPKIDYTFDTDDLIDATMVVTLTQRPYNNEMQNDFKNPKPFVVAYDGNEQQAGEQQQTNGDGAGQTQAAEDVTQPQGDSQPQERTARRRVTQA